MRDAKSFPPPFCSSICSSSRRLMAARCRPLLLKEQGIVNASPRFIFDVLNNINITSSCLSAHCPHHLLQELIYGEQRPWVKVRVPFLLWIIHLSQD